MSQSLESGVCLALFDFQMVVLPDICLRSSDGLWETWTMRGKGHSLGCDVDDSKISYQVFSLVECGA